MPSKRTVLEPGLCEPIKPGYKHNFSTMQRAFADGNVCLLSCLEKSTGKSVVVVCAVQWGSDGGGELVPLSKMFSGNPYAELLPPNAPDMEQVLKPLRDKQTASLPSAGSAACPACNGTGFLLSNVESAGNLAIQRCDTCAIYKSDTEAITAVAKAATAYLSEVGGATHARD